MLRKGFLVRYLNGTVTTVRSGVSSRNRNPARYAMGKLRSINSRSVSGLEMVRRKAAAAGVSGNAAEWEVGMGEQSREGESRRNN